MRPTIYLAVIGLVAIIIALLLNFRETGNDVADAPVESPQPAKAVPAPAGDTGSPSSASEQTVGATNPDATGSGVMPKPSETVTEKPQDPPPPSYDIVRVNPKGDAVMAGRAAPGASVEIRDDDKVIGKVTADQRGEWVFVPDKPLAPGNRQLSLSATTDDGQRQNSETVVVMSIPAPSGASVSSESSGVVVVPKDSRDTEGDKRRSGTAAVTERQATPQTGDVARIKGGETGSAGASPTSVENPVVVELSREPGGQAKILQGPKEGVRSGDLSLDSIDYNDKGELNIQGQVPEGARVQLYLDNKFVGSSEGRSDGQWAVTPQQPIPPGTYKLRVDQVAEGGAVRSRLEIPFARAAPISDLPEGSFVIVQPGNSLWRIARRTYGSGFSFVDIFRANDDQIGNPDLIYPGQIFTLPTAN
ncbi:MAG: Ig-like domain-containing protein [Rhodospirillales bacterium]